MRILLLGGTDLTVAVADRIRGLGLALAGAVFVPRVFEISYARAGVTSSRFADVAAWCADARVPARPYRSMDDVVALADETGADFALAAGWYHMVPRAVRARFPLGCAGLHASLLPKFRGGAPLPWAILAGAPETGISLFELGDGVDDGGLYGQRRFPIGPRTCVGELVRAAEAAALELVADCLPRVAEGRLTLAPQVGAPSYGLQRAPRDGRIDWTRSADEIDRLVRAVGRPYPGAFTLLEDRQLFVWRAEPLAGVDVYGAPGQIARMPDHADPCVVTGRGTLILRDATDGDGHSRLPELRHAANQRLAS